MQIKIHQATSDDIEKYVEQLGQLRIEVFKEWPYLYEGDLNYEREYLKSYVTAKDAVCFLLRQDQEVIGASTAIAMSEADGEQSFSPAEKSLPDKKATLTVSSAPWSDLMITHFVQLGIVP